MRACRRPAAAPRAARLCAHRRQKPAQRSAEAVLAVDRAARTHLVDCKARKSRDQIPPAPRLARPPHRESHDLRQAAHPFPAARLARQSGSPGQTLPRQRFSAAGPQHRRTSSALPHLPAALNADRRCGSRLGASRSTRARWPRGCRKALRAGTVCRPVPAAQHRIAQGQRRLGGAVGSIGIGEAPELHETRPGRDHRRAAVFGAGTGASGFATPAGVAGVRAIAEPGAAVRTPPCAGGDVGPGRALARALTAGLSAPDGSPRTTTAFSPAEAAARPLPASGWPVAGDGSGRAEATALPAPDGAGCKGVPIGRAKASRDRSLAGRLPQ